MNTSSPNKPKTLALNLAREGVRHTLESELAKARIAFDKDALLTFSGACVPDAVYFAPALPKTVPADYKPTIFVWAAIGGEAQLRKRRLPNGRVVVEDTIDYLKFVADAMERSKKGKDRRPLVGRLIREAIRGRRLMYGGVRVSYTDQGAYNPEVWFFVKA